MLRKRPFPFGGFVMSDLTELRERLIDLSERMDDYLPAPTIEGGWVLDAAHALGALSRERDESSAALVAAEGRLNQIANLSADNHVTLGPLLDALDSIHELALSVPVEGTKK